MEKELAFICDNANNFLVRSMIDELEAAGWEVSAYSSAMNNDFKKTDFSMFIIYLDEFNQDIERLLREMQTVLSAKNKLRRLFIIGTDENINQTYRFIDLALVTHAFKRPVNVDSIIRELNIMYPSTDTKEESIENIEGKPRNENKKTIIIVDDDDIYLKTIETWFTNEYNVYTASSVTSARSMLQKVPFDLILLDYEMPLLSGLDFLRIVRSDEATKDIPVIFLTAKDDKDTVLEILKDKPTGYLLKTTAPITLKYNIKKFFEGKSIWWKAEEDEF